MWFRESPQVTKDARLKISSQPKHFSRLSRRVLEGAGPLAGLLVREITEHERVQIRNPD